MKQLINPKSKIKLLQRVDLKLLKQNANVGVDFSLKKEDYNNPFSIIPDKIYNNFYKDTFVRHKINFPIKVPIYYKRVFVPREFERQVKETPTNVNYGFLTGNQLLLTMMKVDDLNPEEIAEIFDNLVVKSEAKNLDLENNELVKPVIERFMWEMDQWKMEYVARMAFALFELNFKNENLWEKLKKLMFNKIYSFEHISSTHFANFFQLCFEKFENVSEEEKKILIEQLPRYLSKMKPNLIVKAWEIVIENDIITSPKDYLFERHFYFIFWKTPMKFSVREYAKILKHLRSIDVYSYDPEFYQKEFLPTLEKQIQKCTNNEDLHELIQELEQLNQVNVSDDDAEKYIELASQRLLFVEKKLKLIKSTEFIEIVKSDLQKYKEKILKKNAKLRA